MHTLNGHLWTISRLALLLGASAVVSGNAIAEPYGKIHRQPKILEKPVFHYSLSETGIWNSNPLMLRDGVKDIYGSETRAFFGFQKDMATSKVALDLTALRNQYVQSEFNSTDFYAKTNLEKQFQTWLLGFNGSYDYDTTRSSEITTFGRNVGTGRRKSFGLSPSATYLFSQRSSIGLTGRWQETRYENPALIDYRVASLTPAFMYHLSPLQVATLSFQAQRYGILDNSSQHIDSLGPSVTWSYNFHPSWTINLSVGSLASKISGYSGVDSSWAYNLVYGTGLTYHNERHDTSVSATRSRQPYANGTESILTTIQASEKYKINEKVDFEINGNYLFADQPPIQTDNLDKGWGGEAGLRYKIGMNWALDASYKHRNEELANNSKAATQQIIRVGLTYRFGFYK